MRNFAQGLIMWHKFVLVFYKKDKKKKGGVLISFAERQNQEIIFPNTFVNKVYEIAVKRHIQ